MQTLKDIFVSYEIAVQLKEIGFDEPCIAGYYLCQGVHPMLDQMVLNVRGTNGNYDVSAPTWEQVKKWFREKNYSYNTYKASDLTHFSEVYKNNNEYLGGTDFFKTYEEAREALIYKLIEIYKNECKK